MSIIRKIRHPPSYSLRLQNLMLAQQHTSAAGEDEESPNSSIVKILPSACSAAGSFDSAKWKKMDSRTLGIQNSTIKSSAWQVLRILKGKGFGAYLVGGCVRDLLLHKTPKDFDIVTTANLKKIRKHFRRTSIIGRRFPICAVHFNDSYVEVSSFETTGENAKERITTLCSQTKTKSDLEDLVRWRNCMQRDFTINGLLYDPCTNTIYDYVNGMKDIKACKVRTIIPAQLSFKEDCARILRGIRIVARLGLKFTKTTKAAILDFTSLIKSLPKARLMMEMNYMLAYGAAVPSIRLLQKFKLLEILLPLHDLYLQQQAEIKDGETSTMLMALFFRMDALLSTDHPSDCTLWLSLLAFHLALLQWPQDVLTVWTFSSILYHGNINVALRSAKDNVEGCLKFVPEISHFSRIKSDVLIMEDVSRLVSLIKASIDYLVSPDSLALATEELQVPSPSNLVFVSKSMGKNVAKLFDVLDGEFASTFVRRESYDINYVLLKKGDTMETRYVLGKIFVEVLRNRVQQQKKVIMSDGLKQANVKERTLLKRRIKEKKSARTSTPEVNPKLDEIISKKGKVRSKRDSGINHDKTDANSKHMDEYGQIHDNMKQEQSHVMLKCPKGQVKFYGIKQVNIQSAIERESTLMESRIKEEKSEGTKISDEGNPGVNKLFSKRRERNETNNSFNQNTEANVSDLKEYGRTDHGIKQNHIRETKKIRSEKLMHNGTKIENQVVLDDKVESQKLVKKLEQEIGNIKLKNPSIVKHRAEEDNAENKTNQERSLMFHEKKKLKTEALLSELFRC